MNHNIRKLFGAAAVFAILTTGCSTQNSDPASVPSGNDSAQSEDKESSETESDAQIVPSTLLSADPPSSTCDTSSLFTDRDCRETYEEPIAVIQCNGTDISVQGSGCSANGSDLTITDEGVYLISGTLEDGQILVNSTGKVQLVLDGANLTCSDSAPIYVQQAKKCFITLAEGAVNSVSDGNTYVYAEEGANEPDAAIFSADTLTINGSGSLTVSGNYNEGITCKDDLVITGGTLNITSVGNGIKGKDYVAIAGGEITVTAGADGIKSNNAEDAGCGFVYVENGSISIDAQEDGIQAETELIVMGGTFDIVSGGGSANAQPQMQNGVEGFGAHGGFGKNGNWGNYDETETEEENTVSTKALKAGTLVSMTGGECILDSADDGLHSNGDICISGGTVKITAGGDGIHADNLADFIDGTICVLQSGEGIEAAGIRISGGTVEVTASDDGFNASDGTSQGAMGTYTSGAALEISGGNVHVNADGDGLDSNGDMLISGGTVIVDGPTNDGNGALDGNGSMYCTGGLLMAAGCSGMAEYPSGLQNTAVITLPAYQEENTEVVIQDASGTEILSHCPAKSFNSFIVSTADFRNGETYTVYTNGTETGSFTVESTVSYVGESGDMMGGGFHGGFDGGRGNRQDMEMPTDENGEIVIPEDMTMPEGMEPPQGMEMPTDENGEIVIPEDMTMPEGMEPPQGGFRDNGGQGFPGGRMPQGGNGSA